MEKNKLKKQRRKIKKNNENKLKKTTKIKLKETTKKNKFGKNGKNN